MVEIVGVEEEYTQEELAAINAWFEGKNFVPVPDDMYLCLLEIKETVPDNIKRK